MFWYGLLYCLCCFIVYVRLSLAQPWFRVLFEQVVMKGIIFYKTNEQLLTLEISNRSFVKIEN